MEAKNRGCTARVVDAAAHATIDWQKESHLFIVTSTYGEGDPPDNAQNFWQWLQTDAASALAHLNFAVLALGDRNYTEFCAAGKKMDDRLELLGARRIFPRSDCDVDYESTAKAWMEGAFGALLKSATTGAVQSVSANGSANGMFSGLTHNLARVCRKTFVSRGQVRARKCATTKSLCKAADWLMKWAMRWESCR